MFIRPTWRIEPCRARRAAARSARAQSFGPSRSAFGLPSPEQLGSMAVRPVSAEAIGNGAADVALQAFRGFHCVFGLNGTYLAVTVPSSHVMVLPRAFLDLSDGFGITAGRTTPRRWDA
ncbi:protein of unknown function [Methylocaldum szegediense]|uniref:Uncharacterized protein n=1 Tax=Methylocaldum szegediense TaxID=73780 RepID=A0ABN8X2A6_9GAMM|nr:protein of unknown function [Methylocaldum szegediense]